MNLAGIWRGIYMKVIRMGTWVQYDRIKLISVFKQLCLKFAYIFSAQNTSSRQVNCFIVGRQVKLSCMHRRTPRS